jgi:hypothetical protein
MHITVEDTLAGLTRSEHDDLADLVGLYGPAETQSAIARNRGVWRQVVNGNVHRATDRIKNTSALGALDEAVVNRSDPEE